MIMAEHENHINMNYLELNYASNRIIKNYAILQVWHRYSVKVGGTNDLKNISSNASSFPWTLTAVIKYIENEILEAFLVFLKLVIQGIQK